MARFFIDRPIFAWVIAIIIMVAGVISFYDLPVAQYPSIAPPQVSVTARFSGASAQTLEESVTQIIEQQMKGIDNLDYMSSTSDSSGQAEITLTFAAGTDPDTAQVQVQNKLQLATPMLPTEVQQQGVSVTKSSHNFLLVAGIYSDDGSMSQQDISDFVVSQILDPISRVDGVGDVNVFGAQYAMRIWCNPDKMNQYKLNPSDVIAAVKAQNAQVAGGQIGAAPQVEGQQINMTVIAVNRFQTVKQFEDIILHSNSDGSALHLKDVATIELGGEGYNAIARNMGLPASGLGIKMAAGANALDTADRVKAEIERLSHFFPEGLKYSYPYDTTPFVSISMHEVYKTLGEAILLVFLVMYLFLQNMRATIIPTIIVPVVLLGTLTILNFAGFSLNTLTMFAIVLAIGLLVDDAIVVVENVERIMEEERLDAREATKKSMGQISGALLGMTTVLTAVFIPMAFFGGSVGVIYRQFSITIASAMAISLLMAFILTPALCATLLKRREQKAQQGVLGKFNRWFNRISLGYQKRVQTLLSKTTRVLLFYLAFLAILGFLFMRMATSFLPDEDQGILMVSVQLPSGSTFENTLKVLEKVEQHFLVNEAVNVANVMAVAGFSFAGNGQNNALCFVRLKDWSERTSAGQSVQAVVGRAWATLGRLPEASVMSFAPPAVMELGTATGFDFMLQDEGGHGHLALMAARNQLIGMAAQNPKLAAVRPNGLDDVDQYYLDIDLPKATSLGVSVSELYSTIQAYWGSSYINDFMDKGRTKKVYFQADKDFRMQGGDFEKYYIRNSKGDMVPFSAFLSGHVDRGSPRLERYNGVPSLEIQGQASAGASSGEAMDIMEGLVNNLPDGFALSWTGLSHQERISGAQAPALYALSLLIVFLCLAALYESWSIPFSVMLVVPLGVLGAVVGASIRGLSNDVYFQVGLLTTIGLSAKNAILIVEFAKENEENGMGLVEATLNAVQMRLRPIAMTSMAFLLGVFPLVISSGAGSGSQNAIGTGVSAGLLAATTLGLYYTPVFFVLISRVFKVKVIRKNTEHDKMSTTETTGDAHGK